MCRFILYENKQKFENVKIVRAISFYLCYTEENDLEVGAVYQPLADLLRPDILDDVFGQEHILGQGAILRRLIDSGNVPNMIFYGPIGTGKTTVANIIAK